jgi:hypothetical protein
VHPLPEIRLRTLKSIKFKLTSGIAIQGSLFLELVKTYTIEDPDFKYLLDDPIFEEKFMSHLKTMLKDEPEFFVLLPEATRLSFNIFQELFKVCPKVVGGGVILRAELLPISGVRPRKDSLSLAQRS